jgi:uncharacterized membrane protein YdjX (TVP38/TMEM64 family)
VSIRHRTLAVIALTLLIPLVPFLLVGELPGDRWLSAHDGSALTFGIAGSAALASDVFLPIPSSVIGSLLGARLGFTPGFAWAFLGLTMGSLLGYAAGRLLFMRFAADAPTAPTMVAVFLSRPVPVLAEALSVAAGGTRLPLPRFFLASAVGNAAYAAALSASAAALVPAGLVGPALVVPMLVPIAAWLGWKAVAARRPVAEPDGAARP